MLTETKKEQLSNFLINSLGWYELNFCICDEKHQGILITRIYVNSYLKIEDLQKLKEYLNYEQMYVQALDNRKDFNLIIWGA